MIDVDSYTAGVIDGEGSILLTRPSTKSQYKHPTMSVSSTTIELLQFLKEHYGGHICKHKTYKDHHKPHWSWRLSGTAAITACEKLQHLLIVPEKIHRARMIAQVYRSVTPRNGKYSEAQRRAKLQFEYDFYHPSTA